MPAAPEDCRRETRLESRRESLEDTDNVPTPEVPAAEIVDDLEAAPAQFADIIMTRDSGTQE